MEILRRAEILRVFEAAVDAGLANHRAALLAGLTGGFVEGLATSPAPIAQLLMDLHALNDTDRLADGTSPLAVWLDHAAALCGPRAQADVFRAARRALDRALPDASGFDRAIASEGRTHGSSTSLPRGHALGEYRLDALLASGGSAAIWAATHEPSGREVALKIFDRPHEGRSAELLRRLLREARIAARVESAHVCKYIGSGYTPEGRYFLVLERLHGRTLLNLVRAAGPLSLPRLGPLVEQMFLGLEAIHDAGIVHRNLEPHNVFVDTLEQGSPDDRLQRSERVKIIDFGVSLYYRIQSDDETITAMTGAGGRVGTFEFMAPEQIGKPSTVDPRADIYGAGATIFWALTNRRTHMAGNALILIALKKKIPAYSLEEVTGVVWPAPLERFLARALARDPSERFQSAAEALQVWRSIHPGGRPPG